MKDEDVKIKNQKIKAGIEKINDLASKLISEKVMLAETTLELSDSLNGELVFTKLISFLYSVLCEYNSVNLSYIEGKCNSKDAKELEFRKRTIHCFRTFFQHNLPSENDQNGIKSYCAEWYRNCLGQTFPKNENDWSKCNNKMYQDAIEYFDFIVRILQNILSSEEIIRLSLIEQWNKKCYRNYGKYDWEKIVKVVISYYEIEIDSLKFAEKHLTKWNKEIELLRDFFDFKSEAEKIVQREFIDRNIHLITGSEIMSRYAVKGKDVGRILDKQNDLMKEKRIIKKDEMLKELDSLFKDDK